MHKRDGKNTDKRGCTVSFIELKNVTFTYPNDFTAIENINLEIAKGEFLAIVGQNGAGKTTTVKLMNGLLKPQEGEVIIDGWNTNDHTVAKLSSKVGYIFQNPDEQIFNDSIYSEVAFGPKYMKLPIEEIKNRVRTAVDVTKIRPYLNENPYNLPYSTRKFVTIAAIMANDPDVLILDEPTAGQDLYGMEVLADVLKFLKEQGKTVITITHDMEFVVKNFERVVVMANKKIISDSDRRTTFWNHDVLKQSMLKQPYVSRVAYRMGLSGNVLDVNEMISAVKTETGLKEA